MSRYIKAPLLKEQAIESRAYQRKLFKRAYNEHTLICLPTGLGKTPLNLMLTLKRLDDVGGRALFVAPTKPLVTQHARFYRESLTLENEKILVYTGSKKPEERQGEWDTGKIVIATPEVIRNDVSDGRVQLDDFTHISFDECHRASGDYAYVPLARFYHEQSDDPMVTALSASPGSSQSKILDVCNKLGIRNIEVITEDDESVAPYVHDKSVARIEVDLPDGIKKIRNLVQQTIIDRANSLIKRGFYIDNPEQITADELDQLTSECQRMMQNNENDGYAGISLVAQIRKLQTAKKYVSTHSVETFRRYMNRQQKEIDEGDDPSKATIRMMGSDRIEKAISLANTDGLLHPKLKYEKKILQNTLDGSNGKVIIFTGSRDTVDVLNLYLGQDFSDIGQQFSVQHFVGQSDTGANEGMTQDEQQKILDDFHEEKFNVLVSTSVAEEGLDVPEVDRVIFHEPVPSAIRDVQRKGRTGRQTKGAVTILMVPDTRDQTYYGQSHHKRKKMRKNLEELKDIQDVVEEKIGDNTLFD